jgi:8-oxo-dGTP diphosphatase
MEAAAVAVQPSGLEVGFWHLVRFLMRHVTCAIFYRNSTILLGHRTEHVRTYKNTWDVLGGHVEEGETVDEALVREVQEEASVTPTAFYLMGKLTEPHPEINKPAVYYMYGVTAWDGGEPTMLGDEHHEIRWFPIEDACTLPNLALESYIPFFRAVADGKPVF